jgi:hypothetical protein
MANIGLTVLALLIVSLTGCVIHERDVYSSQSYSRRGYYRHDRHRDYPRYPYYYRHRDRHGD